MRRAHFASRCGGERSVRPHRCTALCAEMRSNRPFAVATVCKTRASQTQCEQQFWMFAANGHD
eukprot:8194326-Lingulodinium_polyedra.AAC.1